MASEFNVFWEILSAVASHEGVEETALDPPLFEAVDTDALEALYANSPAESPQPTVSFVYRGHNVVVNRPNEVEIQPAEETA
ncbi:HalOD1 output domain-containing protein [Halorarius litoreus]|uniref:HalOD1 output domain-containing protein n=1 Tax=Halorarius litoreus TaxID=2962676 RepID=UPI0020CB9D9F|nr:HalOD1 output domain-containing protein [Halorarius litoreus]